MPLWSGRKKKNESDITKHEQMKALGIMIATSGELEERMLERDAFKDELSAFENDEFFGPNDKTKSMPLKPDEQIELMATSLNRIDHLLKKVAIPFGRGGTEDWYGQAMLGWEKLLAFARNYCGVSLSMVKRPEEEHVDRLDLVRKLRGFLIVEVLRYAQWIEDVSYYADDISKRTVITIQQPIIPGAGGGGPMPRPSNMGFPPGPG
jgi:hypothetical protein